MMLKAGSASRKVAWIEVLTGLCTLQPRAHISRQPSATTRIFSHNISPPILHQFTQNMDQIEAAIADLRLQDSTNIIATVNPYGVDRSTLSRRWRGVNHSTHSLLSTI
jgi:hypothetical protein